MASHQPAPALSAGIGADDRGRQKISCIWYLISRQVLARQQIKCMAISFFAVHGALSRVLLEMGTYILVRAHVLVMYVLFSRQASTRSAPPFAWWMEALLGSIVIISASPETMYS